MHITQELSKYRLMTNSIKFMQQLHQRQQVTQLSHIYLKVYQDNKSHQAQ